MCEVHDVSIEPGAAHHPARAEPVEPAVRSAKDFDASALAPHRRREHYLAMASATYDLADWSDEPAMIEGYLGLAAKWLQLAEAISPIR